MKIKEIHSHLNGLEFLRVRRTRIWREIQETIARIDQVKCNATESRAETETAEVHYDPTDINIEFTSILHARGWLDNRATDLATGNETSIFSQNQTYLIRDRIAIEVQFGKHSFMAYDLFVNHLAFYIGDKIDVGIEILPMKSLQVQMSSGVPYYEGELYNVIRQGRGVPAVPLVIIGIEP